MIYCVEVQETLCRIINVKAESEVEALAKVETEYKASNIVLDSGDFCDVRFETLEDDHYEEGDEVLD